MNSITSLSRLNKKLILILIDSVAIIAALLASFSMRLGVLYWPENGLIWIIFGAPVVAIPIFLRFGLYRTVIRFIGFSSLWSVVQAISLYALVWGVIGFMAAVGGIPRSVIIINWMLCILAIGGLRMLARWLLSTQPRFNEGSGKNVIIYGAGDTGRQLSNALLNSYEYNNVAFIDDNIDKQGSYISGTPVEPRTKLNELIEEKQVSEVLLALPSVSRKRRNEIIEELRSLPVNVRSLPSVSDLAQGKVRIDDLREISIKDLLGREAVEPNKELLKANITTKVVMVTGAGGSIGSELCRQILFQKPRQLILFEVNEFSLYQLDQELNTIGVPNVEILPILGSVRDRGRLEQICKHFEIHTIYHAAAYKHVPLVEFNNSEGVLNNIIATRITAEVAIAAKVETFVLISTDKAVRPTNTMGVTKRIAELILQAFSQEKHSTCFSMVRFGNVLDSSGSVIPLFKKQIKDGGPVTVTDENIVRYFMTIPEAVELVIQAGAMCKGGDVFVLDMGEPIRIDDLAKRMIQLSGLQVWDESNPSGDIEIKYTGLRPGEKLYEELLVGDNISKTVNPLIMRAIEGRLNWNTLKPILNQLQDAAISSDQERIRELLVEAVPEFKPQCDIQDCLF